MANLFPFLAYVFVTTFTPGPNNILAMTNSMQYGYKKTLGFLLGIATGFMIVMLIAGFLNIALVNVLPQVTSWLNILGAAYMVILALQIMRSKPNLDPKAESKLNSFTGGLLLQFLNPKGILFGISVHSLFIIQSYQNPVIVSLFAPLLAIISLASISCWALGGGMFRRHVQKYGRQFNIAMGVLLLGTAVASLF